MNKNGFTLIELLVVMVIAAVITAMAAPAFISMGRGSELNGAVRSLRSNLSLIRQWSITHKVSTELIVETNAFFALSGEDGTTSVLGSVIKIATNNYDGKLVAEDAGTQTFYKPDGSSIDINYYHYFKISGNYLIDLTCSKSNILINSGTSYKISNKTTLSEPVTFKVIEFKFTALSPVFPANSIGNSLCFVSAGGLKVVSDYRIECANITKSSVVKTVLVRWLTGSVGVLD